ncbi:MAG: M1 family aminopeptidase [Saprospiraceae bacterium]
MCKAADTSKVASSFAYLPFALEALEYWYGPYQWNRVGYAMTTNGAMEHPTNIAFPDFLGNDGDPEVTMDIMAHELAHHWWGDVTTLTTAYDMWIKEGTSEYGMHQFIEYFFGKKRFQDLMRSNSYTVVTSAHINDDGFWSLSGMPMDHTYGTTTYNKGANGNT